MSLNFCGENVIKVENYQHITNSRNSFKILAIKGIFDMGIKHTNIQTGHMAMTTKFILGGKEDENRL
ncbi:MAG: hypothetical protein J7L54_04340 [Elusimicrobia bacterium]|nr:hypothetical protein [Elusimicrobiota bacterium]